MINKLLIISLIFGSEIVLSNLQEVKRCNCFMLGTFEDQSGKSVCDENGVCSCMKNVIGKDCDKCRDGYFGIFSGNGCSFCACNSIGALTQNCDQKTGKCSCKLGYTGFKCEKCSNFAPLIKEKCCKCNQDLSLSQFCDEITGKCQCKPNASGKFCNKCAPNFHFDNETKSCIKCNSCYNSLEEKIKEFNERINILTTAIKNSGDYDKKQFRNALDALEKLMTSLLGALNLKDTSTLNKLGQIFLLTDNLIRKTAVMIEKEKSSSKQKRELLMNYKRAQNDFNDLNELLKVENQIKAINFTIINNFIKEIEVKAGHIEKEAREAEDLDKSLKEIEMKYREVLSKNVIIDDLIAQGEKIKNYGNITNELTLLAKDTLGLLMKGKNFKEKILGLKVPSLIVDFQKDESEFYNKLGSIQKYESVLSNLENQVSKAHDLMQKSAMERSKRVQALIDAKNKQFTELFTKKTNTDKKLSSFKQDFTKFMSKLDQQKLNITVTFDKLTELSGKIRLSTENLAEIHEEFKVLIDEIKNIENNLNDLVTEFYNALDGHKKNLIKLENQAAFQAEKLISLKELMKEFDLVLEELHEYVTFYGINIKLMNVLINIIKQIDRPKLIKELIKIQAQLDSDYKKLVEFNIKDLKREVERIEEIIQAFPPMECKTNNLV